MCTDSAGAADGRDDLDAICRPQLENWIQPDKGARAATHLRGDSFMSTGEEQARTDQFKTNKLGSSHGESMATETEVEGGGRLVVAFCLVQILTCAGTAPKFLFRKR